MFFRASFCRFGAGKVNFRRALGGFREDGDAVAQDFGETLDDGENSAGICARSAISQFADAKLGHERSVSRQNAELSFRAGNYDLNDAFAQELPLRRDDDQFNGFRKHLRLNACLHFFRFRERFFDRADHIESLLGDVVVLAFDDFLKAAHRVFDLDVLAFQARELGRDEHRLR